MKKLLFLTIILAACNGLMAQETQFGVRLGMNLPSLQPKTEFSPGSEYKTSVKFLTGMFANIKIGESTTLQPGLSFSVKGNKSVEQQNTISYGSPIAYTIERNVNIHYLEVPINLLYNKEIDLGTAYLGGGPYAAYAIGGRVRSIDKRDNYIKRGSVEPIEFGDQATELKTADYGINAVAGFRLKNGIDFGASYGFGIANISNIKGTRSQNRQVSFSLGYLF